MKGCGLSDDVVGGDDLVTPGDRVSQDLRGSGTRWWRSLYLSRCLGTQIRTGPTVYRDSATTFIDGRNPYLLTFTKSRLDFTYPPFALVVLSPLTWASFAVTQWLLWGVSIAATTGAVAIVLMDRGYAGRASLWCGSFAWACASMIVLEPARSGVNYGQIEFVLMFLVVVDLLGDVAAVSGDCYWDRCCNQTDSADLRSCPLRAP